jgi:hypothetical protein
VTSKMDDLTAQTLEELQSMVQEGKRLLMLWKRTSKLTKQQKKALRKATKNHLQKSSMRIVINYMRESGEFE